MFKLYIYLVCVLSKSKMSKNVLNSPSRNWMFTINNYSNSDVDELSDLFESDSNLIYLCAGKEVCPSTGTPHLQCYAQWARKSSGQRFSYLRSRLTRAADIAKMYSTPKSCHDYTMKDGDPLTWGSFQLPKQGQNRGEAAKIMLLEGQPMLDVATEHFGLYMRYHRGLEKFAAMQTIKRSWKTQVLFFYGPTGCGKTRLAYEMFPGIHAMDYEKGFWSPYNGQETVLWDDWTTDWITETRFLRLADRYPIPIRQIGGWTEWLPRTLVITSNYGPEVFTPRMSRRIDKVYRWDEITGEGPIITPSPLIQKKSTSSFF